MQSKSITTLTKPNIAVYPGSFDPITLGHMDIIIRSSSMFDLLIVGVAEKISDHGVFDVKERCYFIEESLKEQGLSAKVKVQPFSGLLVDFLHHCNSRIIIRGLRAVSDFDYEYAMFQMNQEAAGSKIETIFFLASKQYSFLSSSIVKEFTRFGRKIENYISPLVNQALIKKFSDPKQNQ